MLRFPSSGINMLWLLSCCVIALLSGCVSFKHLTTVPPAGEPGPKASECGACHVQQHQEWQATVHAKAFTSPTFQEAAGNPPEEECLQCHSPLGMRDGQMVSRTFNREEGITCVSCHLVGEAMHGPHGSTALVSPHSIQEDRTTYTSPSLCAPCHGETHEQWQKATAGKTAPTCQACHQASIQRTVTQGTNVFSDILVAFEKKETTRSHDINLERMAEVPEGITVSVSPVPPGSKATVLEVMIRNNLPHNLPTGTFGSKEIRLVPVIGDEKRQGVAIASAQQALAPGEVKKVQLSLADTDLRSGHLRLSLERSSESHPDRSPIVLASLPLQPAAEVRP